MAEGLNSTNAQFEVIFAAEDHGSEVHDAEVLSDGVGACIGATTFSSNRSVWTRAVWS